MNRFKHALISVVLTIALIFTLCTVKPTPVYASSDAATIAIVLGGVIGGLMVVAVIVTLIVRNNPAWMPALPQAEGAQHRNPWDRPDDRVRFGWSCGVRGGAMPLVCW